MSRRRQPGLNFLTEVREVPVIPYEYRRPKFYGGIAADRAPESARMKLGNGFRDVLPATEDLPSSLRRLAGKQMFAGPLWAHFGHFFVDCVHRLWALELSGGSCDGLVFVAVKGLVGVRSDADLARVQPPPWFHEFMKLLRLPDLPVHLIREPTIVDCLQVPVPGTASRASIQPFYRYYLDRYQERFEAAGALDIVRAPRRIYLSRSHLLHKGGFVGCSYFEAELQRAGVVSLKPEAMDLSLQFANLLGAETILADEGSALHPIQVLSRLKGEVLMFPRRRQNQIYRDAISQRGRFVQLVPADEIEVLSDRFGRNGSPGMLAAYRDPEALYERLRTRDLVQGPFDSEAYRAAEAADLEAARPAKPEVMARWTRELAGLRG